MDEEMWLTLPCDLLVDIFRRLETTAVIRCAATCRPWRRAIIDNASCLRPRPDRFVPDLLIGFFDDRYWSHPRRRDIPVRLQYVPAPNTTAPAFFTPAAGGFSVAVDGRLYERLLFCRDGFLLLGGEMHDRPCRLCLCNPLTGICRVIPAAAAFYNYSCAYVLATGYDVNDSSGGNQTAVWIVAVGRNHDADNGVPYQIFSSASGGWGPIKRSAKLREDTTGVYMYRIRPNPAVVCRGVVYWVVNLFYGQYTRVRQFAFAMDLLTERTWTTAELPVAGESDLVLATSEDGRLSLVKMRPCSYQMEVWVLGGGVDDGQWTLRRTIDVQKLLPSCPRLGKSYTCVTCFCGFCPRSGCLFTTAMDDQDVEHYLLIGIDGSSPRLIGRVSSDFHDRFPYELDWSTYISKLKYF